MILKYAKSYNAFLCPPNVPGPPMNIYVIFLCVAWIATK